MNEIKTIANDLQSIGTFNALSQYHQHLAKQLIEHLIKISSLGKTTSADRSQDFRSYESIYKDTILSVNVYKTIYLFGSNDLTYSITVYLKPDISVFKAHINKTNNSFDIEALRIGKWLNHLEVLSEELREKEKVSRQEANVREQREKEKKQKDFSPLNDKTLSESVVPKKHALQLACSQCGKTVSETADKCPHCKATEYRDQPCFICGTLVNIQRCYKYKPRYDYDDMTSNEPTVGTVLCSEPYSGTRRLFCGNCWEKLREIDSKAKPPTTIFSCEVCGDPRSFKGYNDLAERGNYTCEECGHNNKVNLKKHDKFSNCQICGNKLNETLEKYIQEPDYKGDRGCHSDTLYHKGFFVHKLCHTHALDAEIRKGVAKGREENLKYQQEKAERDRKKAVKKRQIENDMLFSHLILFGPLIFIGYLVASSGMFGLIIVCIITLMIVGANG